MAIEIFQGTDIQALQEMVNRFETTHKVFATQHSTVMEQQNDYCRIHTTIIVFHNGVKNVLEQV